MNNELSPGGQARREEILRELQGVMARRRAMKIGSRVGVAAAVVAMVGAAVLFSRSHGGPGAPPVMPESMPRMMAMIVETEEGIVERLSASGDLARIELITDGELWEWLDGAGRAEGWVRTGGRVILASDLTPREEEDDGDSAS